MLRVVGGLLKIKISTLFVDGCEGKSKQSKVLTKNIKRRNKEKVEKTSNL